MKNFKAFTLVEVMVCIILTGIVAFFIYTMMLSAHKTYFKVFSVSRQKNDIRYFETLIKKSTNLSTNRNDDKELITKSKPPPERAQSSFTA